MVIVHDNRRNGILFSNIITNIFLENGIIIYQAKNNSIRPTPFWSFAIRNLKAMGGINITASHNPKEYNGFKVNNDLGEGILPNIIKKIENEMMKISFNHIFKNIEN